CTTLFSSWCAKRCTELSFFFFSSRRRHTRLVSDWSSDVCSSDLLADTGTGYAHPAYADGQFAPDAGGYPDGGYPAMDDGTYAERSEERRVGKEGRTRWSPDQ